MSRIFLAKYPNAVIIELGRGLETRLFRIDLPSGVDFYNIDSPDVIELRRRLFPAYEQETTLGASLEDEGWLNAVSVHRPAIIVADGVLAFLTPRALKSFYIG